MNPNISFMWSKISNSILKSARIQTTIPNILGGKGEILNLRLVVDSLPVWLTAPSFHIQSLHDNSIEKH